MFLISGASRGIGKYLFDHYTSEGQLVMGTYKSTKPLEPLTAIQFALAIPLDDVVVTINTPTPGTTQYNKEAPTCGALDTTDWSQYNYWRPVFVPRGLSAEILLKKHREFYRRFYLRPKIVARFLLSFFSSGGIRRLNSIIRSLPFLFRKNRKNRAIVR